MDASGDKATMGGGDAGEGGGSGAAAAVSAGARDNSVCVEHDAS